MTQSRTRWAAQFGCLWIEEWPVWVAVEATPSLRGHPVIVHRAGRILARSDEAKAHGIGLSWTVARAQSLVPQVLAVPHDAGACAYAWEQVLDALFQVTPRLEAMREGWACFEVPTRSVGRRVLTDRVEQWGARCGVASNRAVAELAALTAFKGRVRAVRIGHDGSFTAGVPLQVLAQAGLSAHTLDRLQWFGIQRVGQLRTLTRSQLKEQFEEGELLARFAHANTSAREVRPIAAYTPPSIIEARLVFEVSATQPSEWQTALTQLIAHAIAQLCGRTAGVLGIAVETSRGRQAASRILRDPVRHARNLHEPAQALLKQILPTDTSAPPLIEALEVRLSGLNRAAEQGRLFECRHDRQRQRAHRLARVLRHLEKRCAGAVQRLQVRDEHAVLREERVALAPLVLSSDLSTGAAHDLQMLARTRTASAPYSRRGAKSLARR